MNKSYRIYVTRVIAGGDVEKLELDLDGLLDISFVLHDEDRLVVSVLNNGTGIFVRNPGDRVDSNIAIHPSAANEVYIEPVY